MADARDPRSPPTRSGKSSSRAASSRSARARQWTARELRDIRSIYYLIGHIERDAATMGLSEVAKILSMATLVIQDEITLAQNGRSEMLTLVKS